MHKHKEQSIFSRYLEEVCVHYIWANAAVNTRAFVSTLPHYQFRKHKSLYMRQLLWGQNSALFHPVRKRTQVISHSFNFIPLPLLHIYIIYERQLSRTVKCNGIPFNQPSIHLNNWNGSSLQVRTTTEFVKSINCTTSKARMKMDWYWTC